MKPSIRLLTECSGGEVQVCGAVVRTEIIDQGPAGAPTAMKGIDVDASFVEDMMVGGDLVGIVAVVNPTRRS